MTQITNSREITALDLLIEQCGPQLEKLKTWEKCDLAAAICLKLSIVEVEMNLTFALVLTDYDISTSNTVEVLLGLLEGATDRELRSLLVTLASAIAQEKSAS